MESIQSLFKKFKQLPITNENFFLYERLLSLTQIDFFTLISEILQGRLDIEDTRSIFYEKTTINRSINTNNALPNLINENNLSTQIQTNYNNILFGNQSTKEALMLLDFTDEKFRIQNELAKQGVIISDADVEEIIIGKENYKTVSTDIEKTLNKEQQLYFSNLLASKINGEI
jgi:hypothetical protein